MASARLIPICDASALAERGDGVRFAVRVGQRAATGFVVRFGGRVFAYLNRCAHVALELDWNEGRFFDADGLVLLCATHGAAYAPESGRCVDGPCTGRGGLRSITVIERDGWIWWEPDAEVRSAPPPD